MANLTGTETLFVDGQDSLGRPSGSTFQTTTGAIAALADSIGNFNNILRQQGWTPINSNADNFSNRIMSSTNGANQFNGNITATFCNNGVTFSWLEKPLVSVQSIRLLLTGLIGQFSPSPDDEIPASNDFYCQIAICADPTQAPSTAAGEEYPVLYNGERIFKIPQSGFVLTDACPYPVVAGTAYYVKIWIGVTGWTNGLPCAGISVAGNDGTENTPATLGSNEGFVPDNSIGAAMIVSATTTAFSYCAILGYTGTAYRKVLGIIGDSIPSGAYDAGGSYLGSSNTGGGYGTRIAAQSFALRDNYPSPTAIMPWLKAARPSGLLKDFITANNHKWSLQLMTYATTVLSSYGTNDFNGNDTLANIKANTLTLANLVVTNGQKIIITTLTPYSTSTDGFITAANQTVTNSTNEIIRVGFNTWLRDTSSNGFVAQAIASGIPANMVAVWDKTVFVEVNSSNVITLNGGLWISPKNGIQHTGSITSVQSTSGFSDTASAIAGTGNYNFYKGMSVNMTSGNNNTKSYPIWYWNNVAGLFYMFNAQGGTTFTIGDTYNVYNDCGTYEGLHPSTLTHAIMAQNFPVGLIA